MKITVGLDKPHMIKTISKRPCMEGGDEWPSPLLNRGGSAAAGNLGGVVSSG